MCCKKKGIKPHLPVYVRNYSCLIIRIDPEMRKPLMEQKHARAAQNIVRTFSKLTWRLRNSPGNTTSFLTDGRTDTNRYSTLHSPAQKTGSSELWRILMSSRIVCCFAHGRQQKVSAIVGQKYGIRYRKTYEIRHLTFHFVKSFPPGPLFTTNQ